MRRASAPPRLPSPRHLAWLGSLLPNERAVDAAAVVAHIAQDPEAARVLDVVRRFVTLVRDRPAPPVAAAALEAWLDDAERCGTRAVEPFATGLRQDGAAVRAALTTP